MMEVKLWIAKQLIDHATGEFARDISSSETPPMSVSRNPVKTCLLFDELVGLLKARFSAQQGPLSLKQR